MVKYMLERDLVPIYENRKSYYGKARIKDTPGGKCLYSYNKPVCAIDNKKIRLLVYWNYSATTLRHVKEFIAQETGEHLSKKELQKRYTLQQKINQYSTHFCTFIDDYKKANPGDHFFDSDTLEFFGERLSEMRILQKLVTVENDWGEKYTCFCLSSLQRNALGAKRRHYSYFDVETLKHIAV